MQLETMANVVPHSWLLFDFAFTKFRCCQDRSVHNVYDTICCCLGSVVVDSRGGSGCCSAFVAKV